jgi:two-component system phosphate regulon sensor histidine kinase PhoR
VDKVRKDFVANVSHELRTPLTSIKGYAETLSDWDVEEISKARSFAQIILKHANRLSTLVEDLLSLTRLESENSSSTKAEIDLRKVVEASVLMVKPTAEAKRLTIDIQGVPENATVWANRDQIGQALVNLLDNAIKYTPEGGSITVSERVSGDERCIAVKDTGIGIPREDLNRIFERFYRVDKNRSREMGGTGLGLSIVKHIIQGHGGRVWVESELEEGSSFSFCLPRKQREDAPTAE